MLIILQENIIVRLVQLDQVALQTQGFQIGIAQEDVKIRNVGDHGRNLGGVVGIPEVGAHPVLQIDRLAHVNNGALAVLHQVAARTFRQLGDLQFQVLAPVDLSHGCVPPTKQYVKRGLPHRDSPKTSTKWHRHSVEFCTHSLVERLRRSPGRSFV